MGRIFEIEDNETGQVFEIEERGDPKASTSQATLNPYQQGLQDAEEKKSKFLRNLLANAILPGSTLVPGVGELASGQVEQALDINPNLREIPFIGNDRFGPGERSKIGDAFERPAAMNRAAVLANPKASVLGPMSGTAALTGIFGEEASMAAKKGAILPEDVPTLQSVVLDNQDRSKDTASVIANFARGMDDSIAGLAADIYVDPMNALISGVASIPGLSKSIPVASKATQDASKQTVNIFIKAVKPTIKGRTAHQLNKVKKHIVSAVDSIVDNARNLRLPNGDGTTTNRLPQSMEDLLVAFSQTRKAIYTQIDDMIKSAGRQQYKIDLSAMADDLLKQFSGLKDDVVTGAREHVLHLSKALKERKFGSLQEVEDTIISLNSELSSFLRAEGGKSVRGQINNKLVQLMRAELNRVVTQSEGPGLDILKKAYGSLVATEGSVFNATVKQAKTAGGLFENGANMIALYQSLTGGLSGLAKGAATKASQLFFKRMQDPNRMITKMFQQALKGKKSREIGLLKLLINSSKGRELAQKGVAATTIATPRATQE